MILIDMQGYQSLSKTRGIGRYTYNFVKEFLKEEDTILLFNSAFENYYEDIKKFSEAKIYLFHPNNDLKASELIREKVIEDINPEAVLVTSLFEGLGDKSVVTIKKFSKVPTAVIFYDAIPLLHQELFLKDEAVKNWYFEKLENLKRADLLLSISESSKKEAVKYIGIDEKKIVNISSAININKELEDFDIVKERFNIKKPYLLHVSACDERKNFEGLIRAFGKTSIKNDYQLIFVCKASEEYKNYLLNLAKENGVDLIITGYVKDKTLHTLYKNANLFVFPSFHEGFGLPVLEAMYFDTPVIGSNTSSIPEVIGLKEALFNPYDLDSIAKKIEEVLTNKNLYNKLKSYIKIQREKFSWEKTVKRAIKAIESIKSKNYPKTDFTKIAKKEIFRLNKIKNKTIRIEGPFDSSYSLALLNRETAKALDKLGYEVSLYSTEGFGDFEPNLENYPEVKKFYTKEKKEVDIVSRNLYPPRVDNMIGKIKMFHHYAWEESGFVDEWVNGFNENLNCLSTLSTHVKKIMIDNGVKIPMLVSGCGVEHLENIKPKKIDLPKLNDFVFLHISSCFPRKGVDILLDAYEMAFTKKDNVSLIIKTFPNPHNNIEEMLKEKQKNENFPHVVLINKDLTQEEIKYLYTISHCLVAPSRAEGFGLPVAEAMLEGVSVIVTKWGGWLDFCKEDNAYFVDFKFKKAKTHFNLINSVWAEVDRKDLSKKLKEVFNTDKEKLQQKARKGAKLLKQNFTWIKSANRMINTTFIKPKKTKIGWMSSWAIKCGIATYSKHLIDNFTNKPLIFATYTSTDPFSLRSWNFEDNLDYLEELIKKAEIDVLVIQFNYAFFDFKKFNKFLNNITDYTKVIVELHSTYDHPLISHKKLEMIDFSKVKRVLVHNIDDLNRLKELGYVDNVTLFPHGVLDFESKEKIQENLLATYGFFLPHKGLLETIEAMKILKDRGYNYKLKMLNAEYPIDISKQLIKKAKELISKYNLDIELITDFLDDETCLNELSKARVVLFPYKETGESASGAVRYALAANRDILVSKSKIFDEVRDCGFTLKGTTPKEIAESIIEYFNSSNEEVKKYRKEWLKYHRYSVIAKRLENMIESININE